MLRTCLGLASLLLAPCIASAVNAAKVTLSGEVTYLERMALPPGASLKVSLFDVSRAGATATVEAEGRLAANGQAPLSFTLSFEDGVIVSGHSYALRAEIAVAGATWFRNAAAYPVDPLTPAGPISILVNYARQAAPAAAPESTPTPPAELFDVTWRAEEIAGRPTLPRTQSTLSIATDMRAGGRGGCNSYFSQTEITGNLIRFSAAAATRMACLSDSIGAQETAFFAALEAARAFNLSGDELVFFDSAGQPVVRFLKAAR